MNLQKAGGVYTSKYFVSMKFFLLLMLSFFSLATFSAANFTSDKVAGCPPLVVNFTDQSNIGPISWKWDFNNGNTSTLQNPSAVFLSSGLYKVKLIVSNGTETDTVVKTITVYQLPIVNFTVNRPNSCLGDTLTFTSHNTTFDAPIVQYAWGFGNGVANSSVVPSYVYQQTGGYDITLVVQDSVGCTASLTKPDYVRVFNKPVAAFTASPTSSCQPTQLVSFTNQSTGNGLTYFWQFDPTASSTVANPTYLYQQEITNAVLTVTDSIGCTSQASRHIAIATLTADFIASKLNPCTGEPVTFANTSTIQGNNWRWNFGDGTTATTSNATKVYTVAGVYTVSFWVSAAGGCADSILKTAYITVKTGFKVPLASFTADSTLTCGRPLTVIFTNTTPVDSGCTYSWDFGDGDTSNLQNPTETFTAPGNYTIVLVITDSNGCKITGSQSSLIQTARPVAKFTVAGNACLGSSVNFGNQSTNAQAYFWRFGDGDSTYAASPSHLYTDTGYFSVTLVAYNKGGCDTSVTLVNCVHITKVNVDFHVNSTFSPCPPFVCLLTNQSDVRVNKFHWDFGDGGTDTAENPTHIYFYPGVYTVSLVGTTPQGCYDTIVYPHLITVQGPTGVFTVTPKTGCIPLEVTVNVTPSTNTKSMWCDLGDGTVINDTAHILHTYYQVRVYHPQFVLVDYVGCTVPYPLDSVTTHSVPQLTVSDTTVCAGNPVTLSVTSDVSQIQWTPSTLLSCATCNIVSLIPMDSMVYQVTATNGFGCQTTGLVYVNAVPLPVLYDSVSARLCGGDSKTLFVGNASKIAWSPSLYLNDTTIAHPVCTPLASIVYSVTASNMLGCSVTTHVPITVQNKVAVSLPADLKVCTDGSVSLPTSIIFASDLGATYSWNNAQYLNDPTSADPLVTLKNTTMDFTVIVSSGHCIPDTETVQVQVVATPDIEVSSTVATTPMADVPLYAASHQELTYQWFSKDSLSCTDCRKTDLFPTQSQTVYVEGTNSTGCMVRDSVFIDVLGCDGKTIYMPNTFTPNGDGLNDKFFIRTATLSSIKYFRIFDEWGNMVFETNHLEEGWDGSINGKAAAQAVYVYVLEGKCQNGYDVIKTGNVTAIR